MCNLDVWWKQFEVRSEKEAKYKVKDRISYCHSSNERHISHAHVKQADCMFSKTQIFSEAKA